MKYIYVLEDDPKLQKQIYEALRKTEPQAQIRYFLSLESFQKWLTIALKDGQQALHQGGEKLESDPTPMTTSWDATDDLLLLISKEEWLGSRYVNLIKKTIEAFIRKKLCTIEDPTRMLITAFESPDFDIKLVEDKIINNVIFKPFDELILQQQLHFALKGHHPASQAFVHKVQIGLEIEMTKEVQMEAVGDVGFVTRSPREIKTMQVSKYYGDVFKGVGRTHIMARCIACEPHPSFPGEFRVWFSYFGIPSTQISDIRKSMVKRNEIEFSANSPLEKKVEAPKNLLAKPEAATKPEWIILDANKDRVTKFKKILENTVHAQVKVFSSFDAFFFQTDPAGAENSRKEKPWVDTEKITLHLDARGDVVLKIFPEDQENKKIFGEPFAEFKKHSLHSKLHEHSLHTLKSWIAAGASDNELLLFVHAGNFFTLKVTSFKKVDTHLEIELVEPQIFEKTKWFDEKFPTPHSAHAILVGEEYVHEEKIAFWEEFKKSAEAKKKNPKFIAVFKQVPDEKLVRKLTLFEDIFESSNESAYIERKLKWSGGDHGDGSKAFLNSCQELIRVANPVAIAELSEAGLIMNYYRPLDVGVFRKFVLSKTAETFNEYSAICNYAIEHPTEKGMYQAHFVFFGIMDGHLKSIRVWILDNYVHSKQEEGA